MISSTALTASQLLQRSSPCNQPLILLQSLAQSMEFMKCFGEVSLALGRSRAQETLQSVEYCFLMHTDVTEA